MSMNRTLLPAVLGFARRREMFCLIVLRCAIIHTPQRELQNPNTHTSPPYTHTHILSLYIHTHTHTLSLYSPTQSHSFLPIYGPHCRSTFNWFVLCNLVLKVNEHPDLSTIPFSCVITLNLPI